MKNLRFVTFAAFAIFALCLTAQAQKAFTYSAENGATGDRRQEITITITKKEKGYEVSGYILYGGGFADLEEVDKYCTIRGSYSPANERLSATAYCNGTEIDVDAIKIKGKDALQIKKPFAAIATRNGEKSTKTEKTSELNVSGTWDFKCCDNKYAGKLTLVQDGNKISGNFGETTNGTTGEIKGQINGNSLTFTRKWDGQKQDYVLTVSADGKTLTGNFSGDRNPNFGTDVKATRP